MIINVKYVMPYILFIFFSQPRLICSSWIPWDILHDEVGKTAYRYSLLVGGGALRGWLQDGRLRALPKPVIAGV